MKKKNLYIVFILLLLVLPYTLSFSDKIEFSLIEEDRSFWDKILSQYSIDNKNLLYASYIAYKDKLNDLSIESFQECIKNNSSNTVITGISSYYIGKNYYFIGRYNDAITQFADVYKADLLQFNYIKLAAGLNTAIAYYKLNNIEKFKENLQTVIKDDTEGAYKKKALEMLSSVP